MGRASWDEYFMDIAVVVARRSTCPRKHVGAVIVRDKTILSTGYNGSVRGLPHCDEAGHMMEDGHCVRTIHAEVNAVIQAAKNGSRIDGATIYVTASPCWSCFKMLANAGIREIYYREFYRDIGFDLPFEDIGPFLRPEGLRKDTGILALGARVTVSVGDLEMIQPVHAVSGYLSAADPRPHFGLGAAERAERVEIVWPDGTRQVFTDVAANQNLEVTQGEE